MATATELTNVRVRDIPGVLLEAGRLVLRHWPALLTLALLGVAVRGLVIWLAVPASNVHALLPHVLLILSPLGYLLPIIAMLHLFRSSLPGVARLAASDGPQASTEGRERRLIDVAVSVLVPFLAVYVSAGFIKDDHDRVLNEIAADATQKSLLEGVGYDTGAAALRDRIDFFGWKTILVIVAAAWIVRWALGRFERRTGFVVLAFIGAVVEVYWTTQAARNISDLEAEARTWVESRRAARAVVDGYDTVVAQLGWLSRPAGAATEWLLSLFGSLDAVVIIPIAWLTVGAVVLGHKLSPPRETVPVPHPVWERVPSGARSLLSSAVKDLRERWSAFWGGLRLLAGAGLAPMLAFCLSFLLVLKLPGLILLAVRPIIGPHEYYIAFSPIQVGIATALSMVLTAALLGAAVEWLVSPQARDREDDPEVSAAPSA